MDRIVMLYRSYLGGNLLDALLVCIDCDLLNGLGPAHVVEGPKATICSSRAEDINSVKTHKQTCYARHHGELRLSTIVTGCLHANR